MPPLNIRSLLGIQAALFFALGCGLWVLSGRDGNTFVSFTWRDTGLGLATGLALIALLETLYRAFPAWAEKLARLQSPQFSLLGYPLSPATIIIISLCAGIGEEALFRGGLQTIATDHLPAALAVVLASIPFTLIHFSKPPVAVAQFGIGCLLGAAYLHTGSLLAVMIAHALYDVIALARLQREVRRLGLVDQAANVEG